MKHIYLLSIVCIIFCSSLFAEAADTLRIVSYNTENLFDCKHDLHKEDHDFMPDGLYHWTPDKLAKKLDDVAGVITTIGEQNMPALIGLYEIENENILNQLTQHTPLKTYGYKYIHQESPDVRGIDIALLYREEKFKPLTKEFITIRFPNDSITKTRDIVYAKGILPNGDTLHVFANHFPSRYKRKESEKKRIYVAQVLRAKIDSIWQQSTQAHIIVMGDFNDCPGNPSISSTLKALRPEADEVNPRNLYNLYAHFQDDCTGSYKYKGQWYMYDQIIVSGNMLRPQGSICTSEANAKIYDADFLLEPDVKYSGQKPYRTYVGIKYNNGYSDHLPIYTDIILSKELKKQ